MINITPFHLYAQNIGTSLTMRVSHPSPTPTIIIRDSASRSTIAGAHIQLIHKKDTTWGISNNNGRYVFEKNYMGEVELKVSCLGYKSFEKKLSRTDLKQEYPILILPCCHDAKCAIQCWLYQLLLLILQQIMYFM